MALKAALEPCKTGPYHRPESLQIKVLLMIDQPRTIQWEFKNEKAIPKIVKHNKVAAITDGTSVTKITLFEEFSSKVAEGRNYMMKGYALRGESPSLPHPGD